MGKLVNGNRALWIASAIGGATTVALCIFSLWASFRFAKFEAEMNAARAHREHVDRLVAGEDHGPWMIRTTEASV